jgi:hypothetical protein
MRAQRFYKLGRARARRGECGGGQGGPPAHCSAACMRVAAMVRTYCYPVFGPVSVREIDTTLVLKVLEPIWSKKTETASRLRGRVEAVLDWARRADIGAARTPARWRSHIENLLPSRSQVRKVQHHPALP